MSYRSEVQVKETKTWHSNGCRFATRKEAEEYALDMKKRWTSVIRHRVAKSEEGVNYKFSKRKLLPLLNGR